MLRALASLSLLALVAAVVAAEPPLKATPLGEAGPAAKWAEQLGDRDYQTRERAGKELDALGEAALPALDKVIAAGTPEAVRRAIALAGRIQARADTARAVAAKLVDVSLDDQPFGSVLLEFQKQTGYHFRMNGDQAVLGKKGNFVAKKEPFWVALDRFAADCGLEFDSAAGYNVPVNVPRDQLAEQERMRRQVDRDRIQVQLSQIKVQLSVLKNQEAATAKLLAKLEDADRKEKGAAMEKQLATLKKQIEATAVEIASLEVQYKFATAMPPPAGTIVLRPASSPKPPTVCVVGAIRLQPTAFAGQLPQVSSEVIPLVLTATPEPSLRWVRTTETLITKATTPDGRVLAYDPTAASPTTDGYYPEQQLRQLGRRRFKGEYYGEPVRTDVLGGFAPTPMQSLVRLHMPAGAAVTKLATVEGVMRAKLWGQPETVAAIKSLSGEAARVYGPNNVFLEAKLSPDPNDKTARYLDVELVYDATEVSPQAGSPSGDPLYLEPMPGGGVRALRPRLQPAIRGNPQGLSLTDDSGVEFGMSLRMAETTSLSYDPFTGGNRVLKMKQQYIVRPSKADQGPATRLTFTAIRMREVDLPFKLTDVPVAAGTLDPKLAVPTPQPGFNFDR